MRVSTRGDYGIRALLELSQRFGSGYVQSAEIASARGIPENYLCQLLIALRKAGLIRSRRGPQGGHMLARAPERISLAEALTVLEGPLVMIACAQDEAEGECSIGEHCVVRDVWRYVTQAAHKILQETTFADLARREREERLPPAPKL